MSSAFAKDVKATKEVLSDIAHSLSTSSGEPAKPPPVDPTFTPHPSGSEERAVAAAEAEEKALKAAAIASPGEFAKTYSDTNSGRTAEAAAAASSIAETLSHPPEFGSTSEDRAARDAAEKEATLHAKAEAAAATAARTHPPEFRPRTLAQKLAQEQPEYDPDESLTGGTPRSDMSSPVTAADDDE